VEGEGGAVGGELVEGVDAAAEGGDAAGDEGTAGGIEVSPLAPGTMAEGQVDVPPLFMASLVIPMVAVVAYVMLQLGRRRPLVVEEPEEDDPS